MASKTYKLRALVLRKTKLAEKDLIVTMLDESGMLAKGVAKGARRPGGSLAARLELFNEASVLMARGRSLDVVCEARIVHAGADLAGSIEKSSCAAPLAELLCRVAQPELAQPRVFGIAQAALRLMGAPDARPEACLALSAASLWKVMAQIGFRPSFTTCVNCGKATLAASGPPAFALSVAQGGVFCGSCSIPPDAVWEDAETLRWCEALIMMRFADVLASGIGVGACMNALHLVRQWVRTHVGCNLKSLDFLLTAGLF